MGPVRATRTALSKFVTFSGRARRSEYWWFVAVGFFANALFSIIWTAVFGVFPVEGVPEPSVSPSASGIETASRTFDVLLSPAGVVIKLLIFVLTAFFTVAYLSAAWRRMHDVGRSGWVLFLPHAVLLGGGLLAAAVAALAAAFAGVVPPGSGQPPISEAVAPIMPSLWQALIAVVLLGFFVMALWVFVQLVSSSQQGPNRFGPEPGA